jgi:hypothetical protein
MVIFSIVAVVIVVTIISIIIIPYHMGSSWYFCTWTSSEPHHSDFKMVVLSSLGATLVVQLFFVNKDLSTALLYFFQFF